MIAIEGTWYDGRTSAAEHVTCRIYDSGAVHVQHASDGRPLFTQPYFKAEISSRVADTPRYLAFPGGEKFETADNDSVDRLEARFKTTAWSGFVYRMERRNPYLFVSLALLVLLLWTGMSRGVPWAAKVIAFRLPATILKTAGSQTLDILDRSFFEKTGLDAEQHRQWMANFQPVLAAYPEENLEIVFRKGGPTGPNAFALPDGTIVVTDEMVQIAEHEYELLAVLAHEIGHIVHRHGLRTLIQDSIMGFVLLAITGDVSGSSELLLGLPVLLTELAYSRRFEREADEFALAFLRTRHIPPTHFADLMRRIDDRRPSGSGGEYKKWVNYLSTHPLTEERLKAFE